LLIDGGNKSVRYLAAEEQFVSLGDTGKLRISPDSSRRAFLKLRRHRKDLVWEFSSGNWNCPNVSVAYLDSSTDLSVFLKQTKEDKPIKRNFRAQSSKKPVDCPPILHGEYFGLAFSYRGVSFQIVPILRPEQTTKM
jgi:hypothetical protein